MSISKSQASALAEGFLDSIGSTKEGLRPRETYTELFLLAGEFVEDAQDNLNKSNSNASGKLSSTLVVADPVQEGNIVKANVMMSFYGKFVNKGVKGTKSGSSLAGYSFKNDNPSEKMVSAIAAWQKGGKARSTNVNASKSTYKNEVKNATISAMGAAYAIARSIKQKGLKKTGFIDKAVLTTTEKVSSRLGAALKIDIINSIT
jgi:hypothetical protein